MMLWMAMILFGSGAAITDSNATSVADALWQGEMVVRVVGPIQTQSLANRTGKSSSNISALEFLKEKGFMKIDFTLSIKFQINALGEFSMVETEVMTGEQSLTLERRYQFIEEKFIEKTRITAQNLVKVSERKTMKAVFDHQVRSDETDFDSGILRFVPSGRMNKKGKIQVVGDLNFRFAGDGETLILEERQPPSEEYGKRKVTEKITRFYELPLSFDFQINHRKKNVEGSFPVKVEISNPFPIDGDTDGRRDIFRHQVKTSGSYKLMPLFR